MPNMHLKINKSENEIRRLFFDSNLKKASTTRGLGIVNENASHEWTEVSELRLFSKVVHFKPAGVNRHFCLGRLVNYMCNIYEDEEQTDFASFLTPEDYKLYLKRRDLANKPDIMIFNPAYKIRPTPEMIMAKLRQFYDMQTVENHEYLPDFFTEAKEFSVSSLREPDREGTSSAVSKEADRSLSTPIPSKRKGDSSRSGSPSLSTIMAGAGIAKKKKVLALGNSRSSSPAVPPPKKKES